MDTCTSDTSGTWRANYRWRRVRNRYVLTADHGAWSILEAVDFAGLAAGTPRPALLAELIEHGLLETPGNRGAIEARRAVWTSSHRCGPSLHIVGVTRRCNLYCAYCQASSRPVGAAGEDLTPAVADRIVDFMLQSPARSLTLEFQGGESLLNLAVVEHVVGVASREARAQAKDVSFNLVTNLTLLDAATIATLRRLGVAVCSSLDGPAEVHDAYRHGHSGGSHALVMRNLALARRHGLQVPLLTVLTPRAMRAASEVLGFLASVGVHELCANPVQPIGRAATQASAFSIDDDVYFEQYRRLLDLTFDMTSRGHIMVDRRLSLALAKLTSETDIPYPDFRNPCGAVFGQIAYDINGDIYPCDEARAHRVLRLGNVATHRFEDIAGAREAQAVVEASVPGDPVCTACAYKPYCGLCPVVTYIRTGDLSARPQDEPRCRLSLFIFDYVFERLMTDPESLRVILRYERIRDALHN
jgi:radical SAM protein with 4Fe4S-binding SPASM domain